MKIIQILTITSILLPSSWTLDRNWWKHATIYEVFLKSFKDSNGDGIGDLKGVTSKLDYFVDIGIDTVWITPFYPSSGADGGYDIKDFYGVDPIHGTMEDFEELLREMKIRGLNFVLDLVINHSSDEHEWFQKSIEKVEPYTDYYIWADPKGYSENGEPIPPNKWVSVFDRARPSSAWTWNEQRKQYYFHQFGLKQPDLNLRNANVKKDLKTLIKFWLDKGVAALRIDAVSFFMEDPLLREGDVLAPDAFSKPETIPPSYRFNHPDNYLFLNELYLYLRHYDKKNKRKRETAIIAECFGLANDMKKYFGTAQFPVAHFPLNFQLPLLRDYLDATQMIDYLNVWLKDISPEGASNNWPLGNHDQGRIFNRFHNKEYNYVLLTLVTMLPGTSIIYYGEELSQDLFDFTPNTQRDVVVERDHLRTPMQWDDSINAGFTSGDKPWAPVHPGYWYSNVETQKTQANSSLNFFKDLTSIRKTKISIFGDLELYPISKWVLAFTRTYRGSKLVVVLNLGTESNLVNLHASINDLPPTLAVAARSPNSDYKKGEKFATTSSRRAFSLLRPHSAVVLTTDNK